MTVDDEESESPWQGWLLSNLAIALTFAALLIICAVVWVGMICHQILSRIARCLRRRS